MQTGRKVRVLVTGASGFLGSNVLSALMAHPEAVPIAACRNPEKLPFQFTGEIRQGDLLDAGYRKSVVQGVDAVCHTGTWAAFWGHAQLERSHFYEPAVDLIEQSISQGVKRFLLASSVTIAQKPKDNKPVDDFATPHYTGFWPHLDRLIDLDGYMRQNSRRGTQMINMRLGHFVGKGNDRGMVPALVPRMRTYMVPWLAGGRRRIALVADTDLGEAFALASLAEGLDNYESFNICGPEFPTAREVFQLIASETKSPLPLFSVPYPAGYAFGWLMELLHPLLPGSSPFLTRSLVHVSENWVCSTEYAARKIGYVPKKDWRVAILEALAELKQKGYPWPRLAQAS